MVGKQYRIIETLGKGAFGTVYRAEVIGAGSFKKQVALKVLDYSGDAPEEIALRFRDEARILGLIRHRAVVGVDSLAELETGWAVVMEYVEGVNVSAVVKYGLPPARVVVGIVEEVASALHAAYSAPTDEGEPLRLVHRDIKPANVRVTAQGEVKVLDFGVARAEFASREAHTQAMRFGSLRYMAPEAFDGIEGHATDVFALGIVFAELLAGKRLEEPPKNPERYPAFVKKVTGLGRARVGPNLSDEQLDKVMDLVSDMIAFEPEKRPSARQVERACRDLGSELPDETLRDWSEVHVPALAKKMKRRMTQTGDASSSSAVLVEKTSDMRVDSGEFPVTGADAIDISTATQTRSSPVMAFASMFGAGIGAFVAIAFFALLLAVILFFGYDLLVKEKQVVGTLEEVVPAPEPVPVEEPTPVPDAPEPKPDTDEPDAGDDDDEAAGDDDDAVAAPNPVPVPGPANPVPAPRVSGGTVTVTGDATSVQLVSSGGSFGAGNVPIGTYRVMAIFPGNADSVQAGTLTVRNGEDVTINCVSIMIRCSVK